MTGFSRLVKGVTFGVLALGLLGCVAVISDPADPPPASNSASAPATAPTEAAVKLAPAAMPSPDANVGVGGVLDYADADRILFHGIFGIFLYSIPDGKVVDSLDFGQFGCPVQGSNPVFVFLDKGLTRILIQEPGGQGYRYFVESKQAEKLDASGFEAAMQQAVTGPEARQGEISWKGDAVAKNLTYSKGDRVIHLFR